MKRMLSFLAVAMFVVACGGGDTTGEGGAGSAEAPGGAKGMAKEAGEAAAGAAREMAGEMVPPESAECLDLVKKSEFAAAVPVCLRAVNVDPDNADVQEALSTAQAESAKAQAGEALGGGAEGAASEMEKAKEGALSGMPK